MKQTLLIFAALTAGIALLTALTLLTPLGETAVSGLRNLAEETVAKGQLEAARDLNATKAEFGDETVWLDRAEAEGVILHAHFGTLLSPEDLFKSFDAAFQSELAEEICSSSLVRLNLWLGAVHVYHYTATDNKTEAEYRVSHSDCQA
jgi:hypothetical protein